MCVSWGVSTFVNVYMALMPNQHSTRNFFCTLLRIWESFSEEYQIVPTLAAIWSSNMVSLRLFRYLSWYGLFFDRVVPKIIWYGGSFSTRYTSLVGIDSFFFIWHLDFSEKVLDPGILGLSIKIRAPIQKINRKSVEFALRLFVLCSGKDFRYSIVVTKWFRHGPCTEWGIQEQALRFAHNLH